MPAPQEGLPPQVVATRHAIAAYAAACDYEGLEDLSEVLAGKQGFTFSYGSSESPAAYWKDLEEERGRFREEVMRLFVQTLDLSYCMLTVDQGKKPPVTYYQWPSASCDTPTEKQWDEVVPLYGRKTVDKLKEYGSFLGYRVGIRANGDWVFFVAGD